MSQPKIGDKFLGTDGLWDVTHVVLCEGENKDDPEWDGEPVGFVTLAMGTRTKGKVRLSRLTLLAPGVFTWNQEGAADAFMGDVGSLSEEEEPDVAPEWSEALRKILGREVNEEGVVLALGELDDKAGIKLNDSPFEIAESLSCGLHYHADLGDDGPTAKTELRAMFLSTALQCLGLMAEMDRKK